MSPTVLLERQPERRSRVTWPLELTSIPRALAVRLIWSLQRADGELACFLVPNGDTVDAQIYEDRTLLLAHRWSTEREAVMFASAMRQNLEGNGW